MFETSVEIARSLGQRIKFRRLGIGLTQADAAARAGISYRTWRRLETEGRASIDDLVRAAIALRCEHDLAALFPEPAATSMDALLRQQKAVLAATPKRRLRASSAKVAS
ncbi:helix-turn-helix domain-containing protein [uncultured Sphingomonas sp.]|uniref:helix-turn-helix domain-containing protein n=1 Tax=uncultured Sphingomonas sp. TaxID=158754 RepID=UPI0035CBBE9E